MRFPKGSDRRSHTAELTLQNLLVIPRALTVFGKTISLPYAQFNSGKLAGVDGSQWLITLMFPISDATLLRRVRRGDSVAFVELSRKHEPKILAVSSRILMNREDAEDNAQSTFMRAYFRCGQFRGGSQFSTWLMRVAINEALMRLRRRKSHKEVSLNSDAANNEDLLPDLDVSNVANQERGCIAKDLVDKLCACLSPRLRDLFVLYGMEGWSQDELSQVFGVPTRTIKSRIFRARSQLREEWPKPSDSLATLCFACRELVALTGIEPVFRP